MNITPEIITALIAAVGLPVVIPKIIDVMSAMRSGKAQQEKEENRSLLSRVVSAEKRADAEREFRRAWEEFAGRLRYMLIQLGVPENKLPTEPERHAKENA